MQVAIDMAISNNDTELEVWVAKVVNRLGISEPIVLHPLTTSATIGVLPSQYWMQLLLLPQDHKVPNFSL